MNEFIVEDFDFEVFLDDVEDGVYFEVIEVVENIDWFVVYISEFLVLDLDMFIVFDLNNDELILMFEIIVLSIGFSWDEYINIINL